MTRKKKLYSLLAILLVRYAAGNGDHLRAHFLAGPAVHPNFENFIIESRQQEINSAVRSFSTDVDTLLLLMQTELNDSSLTRLQLYYDSRIFNYDYLSQTSAVHNQISTIENSMAFMDTLEICMLDSMHKVMMGSIAPLDEETLELVTDTLGGETRGVALENGKIRLVLAKAPLQSTASHNAVAVASFSSMNLYTYLKRYLPDDENSRMAGLCRQGWRRGSAGDERRSVRCGQAADCRSGSWKQRRFCAVRMGRKAVASELAAGLVGACEGLSADPGQPDYRPDAGIPQDDYHGLRRQHRGHAVAGLLPAADGA